MDYFNGDDFELCYNKQQVEYRIDKIYDLLNYLEKNRMQMIYDVSSLERSAHDVEGTNIDEDYRDFESLLGNDGLLTFELELKSFLRELQEQMNEYERITHSNYARREEERRQEELRKQQEEQKQTPNTVPHYWWY